MLTRSRAKPVAKAPVAVYRKGRMARNLVLQAQAAEPAVGQVHPHLPAKPPFRADRTAIADQQHAHHRLGTDRGATQVAVVAPHLATQPAQIQSRVDTPKQMIGGNHGFEIELMEKTVLPTTRRTQHRSYSLMKTTPSENRAIPAVQSTFQQPQPTADRRFAPN